MLDAGYSLEQNSVRVFAKISSIKYPASSIQHPFLLSTENILSYTLGYFSSTLEKIN